MFIFVTIMDISDLNTLKIKWKELLKKMSEQLGEEPDIQALLFLIGVQELGHGYRKFTRDEKQDLMHLATCKLLSQYKYYELEGVDAEGWPHYRLTQKLPPMNLKEQNLLLLQSMLQYFAEQGVITVE